MSGSRFFAYKGLESMPTWFVILVAVLAAIGIALAAVCRR